MIKENILLSQLSFNELVEAISNDVLVKMQPLLKPDMQPVQSEKYLSRKEVAILLKVSLPTLNEYTKDQVVKGYRVGGRVLYKQSEIESSLKGIKGK